MSDEQGLAVEPADEFPVGELAEALPHLRRPFSPAAVKWKIQQSYPKGNEPHTAVIVGYIDARLVIERLNLVTGGEWSEKPIRVDGAPNALMYELTVMDQTHIDVGLGQGKDDDMKLKARHSDALKRAAVRFGVGVSLYAIPIMELPIRASAGQLDDGTPNLGLFNGKPTKLRAPQFRWLRDRYEEWLKSEAGANFGAPLDHGDALESAGDLAEAPPEEDAAAGAPPVSADTQQIATLTAECETIAKAVRTLDSSALPDQSYIAGLEENSYSVAKVEEFREKLLRLQTSIEAFELLAAEAEKRLPATEFKALLGRAERRGSRSERVQVMEEGLAAIETQEAGEKAHGDGDGE